MTYAGGKGRDGVWQVIINQMPPHDFYCEPFLGAASVMVHKRPALFNVGYDQLADCVSAARAQFCDKRSTRLPQKAPVLTRSLAHLFDHFDQCADQLASPRGILAQKLTMPEFRFERGDALKLLREGDFLKCGDAVMGLPKRKLRGALLYVDPPYLVDTRRVRAPLYEHEFSDWQHIELIKILRAMRGAMIIVSGYPSKLYGDLLHDWRVVEFKNVNRAGQSVTEFLWCNFDAPLELHDYRYIGADFRERERVRRIQRNFLGKLKRLPALERQALMIEALALMRDL